VPKVLNLKLLLLKRVKGNLRYGSAEIFHLVLKLYFNPIEKLEVTDVEKSLLLCLALVWLRSTIVLPSARKV
jgi:hypothetical protein